MKIWSQKGLGKPEMKFTTFDLAKPNFKAICMLSIVGLHMMN